jgi:hypothetical protein
VIKWVELDVGMPGISGDGGYPNWCRSIPTLKSATMGSGDCVKKKIHHQVGTSFEHGNISYIRFLLWENHRKSSPKQVEKEGFSLFD